MKWIGGVILLIVTIVLLILGMFMFPWYSTKTNYEREKINNDPNLSGYWDDNLNGVERDWDESVYYLQDYELKTSRPWNWSGHSTESTSLGKIKYNSQPSSGGWDGSYRNMVEADYPIPGFLAGGAEQLGVFNFTYYMVIFAIILAIIGIITIPIAGLNKIGTTLPKVIVVVTIILVFLGPIYFAVFLPPAIETDTKELHQVDDVFNQNSTYKRPAEAGGIMGKANEKDDESGDITSTTNFSPGMGWWLAIGAIFTTIISIGFISGSAKDEPSTPEYSRRKYHEFDDSYGEDYDRGYTDRQQPPRRHEGPDRYPDQTYIPRESARAGGRDLYYDDYDREPRRRRAPPPPEPGYGRPPPRPPRRSRRPPPRY